MISSSGLYGAERVLLNLTAGLQDRGLEVTLAMLQSSGQNDPAVESAAAKSAIRVCLVPCARYPTIAALKELKRTIVAGGIDIVHSHGYKADTFSALSRLDGQRRVATCHNWTQESMRVHLYNAIDRLSLRRMDRIVAVSEAIRDRVVASGIEERKVEIIFNGVDSPPLAARTANPVFRFGIVGRIAPEKGHRVLLHAAARLKTAGMAFHLDVIGEGPDRNEIEEAAVAIGLQTCVSFQGRRDDMDAVYASLDCLVLPSLSEGLPMVLLEAATAGVPVIASEVGAVSSVVKHEWSGLLVAPGDVEALVAAMMRVLRDAEERSAWTNNARQIATEKFSIGSMVDSYIRVYEECG